ncbi:hypothetical protein CTH_2249 [Carboxydocella thermautotrophica]|nr:hypothetical protein CTH_2249 [Carboxydocella thermautotrophica]
MGSAPNNYQNPKTDWAAGNIPTASDFNRIEGNILAVEENARTIDPAQAPTGNSGSLRQFLDWLANRVKAITGKANWYDNPDITLASLAAHKSRHATGGPDQLTPADIGAASQAALDAHANRTDNPHSVTADQIGASNILSQLLSVDGPGSGLDADTVDGKHASDFVVLSDLPSVVKVVNPNSLNKQQAYTYTSASNTDSSASFVKQNWHNKVRVYYHFVDAYGSGSSSANYTVAINNTVVKSSSISGDGFDVWVNDIYDITNIAKGQTVTITIHITPISGYTAVRDLYLYTEDELDLRFT